MGSYYRQFTTRAQAEKVARQVERDYLKAGKKSKATIVVIYEIHMSRPIKLKMQTRSQQKQYASFFGRL